MAGYFTDASLIRRIHREQVVALSGSRALLLQASHPVAFAGFFMSTGSLDDPYGRLHRTARVLDTVIFGEREAADTVTAAVRRVHAATRGVLPAAAGKFAAGTPWAADDPELMLWILAALADSGALVHEHCVGALSEREHEAYWRDWRTVGQLFGLGAADMPATIAELRAYMAEMLGGDLLHVSADARTLGIEIVLRPPVPPPARPLLELANLVTVGLLPTRIRRQYGLRWDPLRAALLRAGTESTRRIVMPALPAGVRFRRGGSRPRGGQRQSPLSGLNASSQPT